MFTLWLIEMCGETLPASAWAVYNWEASLRILFTFFLKFKTTHALVTHDVARPHYTQLP